MLKDASYKDKFAMIHTWMPLIVDEIKKDLRNDHLKGDPGFIKEYLEGKNPAKLTSVELAEGYAKAIANSERSEEIAEFVANRWLIKHSDLYYYFEKELSKISPNFNELVDIDKETATHTLKGAVDQFGTVHTYLFCVLNSVVFPKEIFEKMSHDATHQASKDKASADEAKEREAKEKEERNHALELARLTDKYEKRLMGLQKKYLQDMESLKKQLAALQRKMAP
jgi:hypothetical protein